MKAMKKMMEGMMPMMMKGVSPEEKQEMMLKMMPMMMAEMMPKMMPKLLDQMHGEGANERMFDTMGKMMPHICEVLDKAALAEAIQARLGEAAVLLVKGSRGMRMEEVVESLTRQAPAC